MQALMKAKAPLNTTDLQVLHFEGHEVRCQMQADGPWLVARDLAAPLQIRMIRNAIADLEPEDKGVVLINTLGGRQKLSILSQSGAYQIIAQSRKPVGKRLRKWMADLTVAFERGKLESSQSADSERWKTLESTLATLAATVKALTETTSLVLGPYIGAVKPSKVPNTHGAQPLPDMRFVKEFLEERTELGLGYIVKSLDLFTAFVEWSTPRGVHWTHCKFGRVLTSLGYSRKKMFQGRVWHVLGLQLKP